MGYYDKYLYLLANVVFSSSKNQEDANGLLNLKDKNVPRDLGQENILLLYFLSIFQYHILFQDKILDAAVLYAENEINQPLYPSQSNLFEICLTCR